MWFLAIVFAGMLFATFRLTTRYEYGPKSRRLLLLELGASLVAGLLVAHAYAATAGLLYYLVAVVVALPTFVLAAFLTAEVLRKRRQRVYDARLEELQAREQDLERQRETADRQVRADLHRREEAESSARGQEERSAELRRKIETWKHSGGAARIRSVKVGEWEREFRALDEAGLTQRRAALRRELAEAADPERRMQVEVMLAVTELVAEGDEAGGHAGETRTVERDVAEAARRKREIDAELVSVRAAMTEAKRQLSDFLAREIRLD